MPFIDYLTVVISEEASRFPAKKLKIKEKGRGSYLGDREIVRIAKCWRNDDETLDTIYSLTREGVVHVSRIDLAEDFFGDYANEVEAWSKSLNITVGVFKSPGGATYYGGSRRSETMARVYDKAKEVYRATRCLVPPLWRVEFELKRKAANSAFLLLREKDGMIDLFSFLLQKFGLQKVFDVQVEGGVQPADLFKRANPVYRHLNRATLREIERSLRRGDGEAMAFLEELLEVLKCTSR